MKKKKKSKKQKQLQKKYDKVVNNIADIIKINKGLGYETELTGIKKGKFSKGKMKQAEDYLKELSKNGDKMFFKIIDGEKYSKKQIKHLTYNDEADHKILNKLKIKNLIKDLEYFETMEIAKPLKANLLSLGEEAMEMLGEWYSSNEEDAIECRVCLMSRGETAYEGVKEVRDLINEKLSNIKDNISNKYEKSQINESIENIEGDIESRQDEELNKKTKTYQKLIKNTMEKKDFKKGEYSIQAITNVKNIFNEVTEENLNAYDRIVDLVLNFVPGLKQVNVATSIIERAISEPTAKSTLTKIGKKFTNETLTDKEIKGVGKLFGNLTRFLK